MGQSLSDFIPDDPTRQSERPNPNRIHQINGDADAPTGRSCRLITRRVEELRPHPRYAQLGFKPPASKLNALIERGEQAFCDPVAVTSGGIIIDGYARWELAKRKNRPVLFCIEYELSEAVALRKLLQQHGRSHGLNAFSRIMLALGLEPQITENARSNQQIGGQKKGWSKLTKAEQVHVRSEIAKAAAVSAGNVTKVKQLTASCVPECIDALYTGEISIHWCWKLRNVSPEDQLDALGRLRFEKGLMMEIRQRAAVRRKGGRSGSPNASEIVSRLNSMGREKLKAVRATILNGPEAEIFITKALARMLGLEQRTPWNQSTYYDNSSQTTESFGTGTESDRRSATI